MLQGQDLKGSSWALLPRWRSGKETVFQSRRCRFHPQVGKIPWRRKWQPTPVFLPGKSHGKKNLGSYSLWGSQRVRYNLATKPQQMGPWRENLERVPLS